MQHTTTRFRFIRAYSVTLRVLLSYLFFRIFRFARNRSRLEEKKNALHRRNARRITRMILELQGLYIKVGQLISILTNFLPETFRAELEELQDRIPPRPVEEIATRIRTEFGKEPTELFATFNPVAVASASLAQVHEATLDDGRRVAVKVQHANIEQIARTDLRTIRSILRLIGKVLGVRGLDDQYKQLEEMILEELDFNRERQNLETIAANFRDDPEVDLPEAIHERSTARVLTTEFVDGIKVSDLSGMAAYNVDPGDLAERVVRAYCRMIFIDGTYHADPHPGNILVRPDGTVVFLDFGAVAVLSPTMKRGIPDFILALIKQDVEGLRNALFDMGFVARDGNREEALEQLDRLHEQLFQRLNLETLTLGEVNAESTKDMKIAAIRDFRDLDISFRSLTSAFRIPKDWLLLERTVLLLIGLCTHLDPEMNPLTTVRPYLEEHVLGSDKSIKDILRNEMRDMAMTAIALPEELRRLLHTANQGKLEIRVRDIQTGSRLVYSLGQQILLALFVLASGAIAYDSHLRNETTIRMIGLCSGALFLVLFFAAMLRGRRYLR